MSRLPLRDLPLHLVLSVYECYVLPLFKYGLTLWGGSCSASAKDSANSSFTKYLKTYLGLPYHANNSITHYLTNTSPLLKTLEFLTPHSLCALSFPPELNGYKLSLYSEPNSLPFTPYNPLPLIPPYFWRSRTLKEIPSSYRNRKRILREIVDVDHHKFCKTTKFHMIDYETCICIGCEEKMSHYHNYFCTSHID